MNNPRPVITRLSAKTLLATVAPLFMLALSFASLATLINDSTLFGRYRLWLLGFNIISIITFFILIAANVASLWRRWRRNEPGSRLTLKLVRQFLPVAIIPAVALYGFSYWAVDRGIASWFSVELETAFDSALKLGRLSLDIQTNQKRQQIEPLLALLAVPDSLVQDLLSSMLTQSGADELVLLSANRRVLSSAGADLDRPLPELVPDEAFPGIDGDKPYISVDTISDGGLYARMVFLLPPSEIFSEPRYLQALFRMSERTNTLAGSVQEAYSQYQSLDYQRGALQQNFILALNLALLLGIFYVVWLAFRSSRKLMQPIVQLSAATQSIAGGDLDIKLSPSPNDDLGFLSSSFNTMAGALAVARKEHENSERQLETQRSYLSAVIERVTSGVLTLDRQFKVITANHAAGEILETPPNALLEQPLSAPDASPAAALLYEQFPIDMALWENGWQSEFTLTTTAEHKTISCSGANLPRGGMVVVFSDVSQLLQAQRNTVWREAAQRFAHEIKNPLTPIQLATERLRNKVSRQLNDASRQLLDDTANTITHQVEAMKSMVDNLRDYALSDPPELVAIDINRVVREVVALYATETTEVRLSLDADHPSVLGNDAQLRQLLHNLIKNALEAIATRDKKLIVVETSKDEDNRRVNLTVRDNGHGFDPQIRGAIFEPYVTTKTRGSGLGLAVVNRIVSAHGGVIQAGDLGGDEQGAFVRVGLRQHTEGHG